MEYSQIYSTVSGFNTDNQESSRKVNEIVNNLEKFRNPNDVTKFLAEKYHLEEGTRKFYLSNTIPVSIKETEKTLSIEIALADEDIIYRYRKGV